MKRGCLMEQDKKVKLLKEISDIKHEQEHIKKLMIENNMQKLNDYLECELTQKYFVEKCIHNMASFSMPDTVQESANNAFEFLDNLKREKEAELVKETLSPKDLL